MNKRSLNYDLLQSRKYRLRVERDRKNDYQRQAKHRHRDPDGGYFFAYNCRFRTLPRSAHENQSRRIFL